MNIDFDYSCDILDPMDLSPEPEYEPMDLDLDREMDLSPEYEPEPEPVSRMEVERMVKEIITGLLSAVVR